MVTGMALRPSVKLLGGGQALLHQLRAEPLRRCYTMGEDESEYMNKDTGTLNKESVIILIDIYENNQKFRDEILLEIKQD